MAKDKTTNVIEINVNRSRTKAKSDLLKNKIVDINEIKRNLEILSEYIIMKTKQIEEKEETDYNNTSYIIRLICEDVAAELRYIARETDKILD